MAELKAGQAVRLTVVKIPRAAGTVKTIEKLMRANPEVARGLKKAHRKRQQTLNVYIRGNRDWTSRVKVGKIVRVVAGATWTMAYSPVFANELSAVAEYLKIEAA